MCSNRHNHHIFYFFFFSFLFILDVGNASLLGKHRNHRERMLCLQKHPTYICYLFLVKAKHPLFYISTPVSKQMHNSLHMGAKEQNGEAYAEYLAVAFLQITLFQSEADPTQHKSRLKSIELLKCLKFCTFSNAYVSGSCFCE